MVRVYTRIMGSPVCICTNLREAARNATALYDRALKPAGLKVTMFRLLRRIEANPDAPISLLAADMQLDRSTLGRNLKVLERQGLVSLSDAEDGRVRAVVLTDKGREALACALPLWSSAQNEISARLGMDVETVLETLNRLAISPEDPEDAV